MRTIDHFVQKKHVNHDQAFNAVVSRFAALIVTADLAMIGLDQFRTMCQLLDGVHTLDKIEAKSLCMSVIETALADQRDFREEIVNVTFVDDAPESRAAFMAKLDVERQHLEDLFTTIQMLSEAQAVALLERVEEVLATFDGRLENKCKTVFEKMQARSQL